MLGQVRDTSSSYLVELRKLATQKRKHDREHNRVGQRRRDAGLTRPEDTTRAWGEGQQETRAECDEERGRHEQVGLGEDETHRLGNEAVHQEEHERVEEHGGLAGLAVEELDVLTRGGEKHTGAERQKKGSRDGNLLRSKVRGKHLIYTQIFFYIVNEMVICSTSHHLLVEAVIIDDTSYVSPNIVEYLVM
jgi:hypothetical protein